MKTIVPSSCASAAHWMPVDSSLSWPVTSVTDVAWGRGGTGMPGGAGGAGDAGVRGAGDGRGDARHDLEGDAGGGELLRLFAAAAEDERIAALEADDALPILRLGHEQRVDLVLRQRVRAGALADVDDLRRLREARHDLARHERVGGDEVGAGDQLRGAHGEKAGIAGTGADEKDFPFAHLSSSMAPRSTSSSKTCCTTASASLPSRVTRRLRSPSISPKNARIVTWPLTVACTATAE